MNENNSNGNDLFKPIQDINGQSPSVMVHSKRQLEKSTGKSNQPQSTMNTNALGIAPEENAYRNHQVNYSFGQQPFSNMQMSQRIGGGNESSAQNSVLMAPDSVGMKTVKTGQLPGNQHQSQQERYMPSHMPSMESEKEQAASKGKASVSMASVMGHFDQPPNSANQVPNIFAQSLQNQQALTGIKNAEIPRNNNTGTNQSQNQPPTQGFRQTRQNFVETATKVNDIEKACSDGLRDAQDRQSQHSVEAERIGLQKSQEGWQTTDDKTTVKKQQFTKQQSSHVSELAQKAMNLVGNIVEAAVDSKVPTSIRDQLINQGFRPSSKQDGQFEYESDSIEIYQMISNEFDYEAVRQLQDFGLKQYKDCIYRGQLNPATRQREGLGVLVYTNGRTYEGEWLKNRRHGRGYEQFSNGNSYHGTHEDGKANGKGVYQWKHGEVYDGEWKQGIKHGYGVWKGQNGESYIGQWENSKAQGYGVHVFANGDKYEGEWFASLREGNGSDFFANGDCYVGQYSQGKPEGFGQYKWKNGSSYTGQFLNGLKHGHGKWKKKQADELGNTTCNQYEGTYVGDKKNGPGVFDWESGNRYEGNYLDDERHGYGVMRWTDESVYMGMWDRGIQHGVGVMVFPDGVKRAGIFEENVFKESLQRKEQIDEFREHLKQDCLDMLEKILLEREQQKANLYGPLNKSKAELLHREMNNADMGIVVGPQDSISQVPQELSETRSFYKEPSDIKMSGYVGKINTNSGSLNQDFPEKRQSTELQNTNQEAEERPQQVPTAAPNPASEYASMMNHTMRIADQEDKNQTMQRGNPMRDSAAVVNNALMQKVASKEQSLKHNQSLNRNSTDAIKTAIQKNPSKEQHNQSLNRNSTDAIKTAIQRNTSKEQTVQTLPDPLFQNDEKPPQPKRNPNLGRTIEVQTDLSMLTMEQYSQGYNSKAFMNKTLEYKKKVAVSDNLSAGGSPAIKYQNDLNQSNKEFQNVLSKPQFQDTKIQQDILGGENPNEDTESEWNRNNSSMMVRKPTNRMNGTVGSSQVKPLAAGRLDLKKNLMSNIKKKSSLNMGRRRRNRSKDKYIGQSSPRNTNVVNRIQRQNPMSLPRDSKAGQPDRSLIQNRQGQRQERSLPQEQMSNNQLSAQLPADPSTGGDFIIPGPQNISKIPKQINRHNVLNLIGENSKRPPQKMFQSQYGGQRFGQGVFGQLQPSKPQPQLPLPPPESVFNQSMMQQSSPSPNSSPRHYNQQYNNAGGGGFNGQQNNDNSSLGFQGVLPYINAGGVQSPKTMYDPATNHLKILHDTPDTHQKLNRHYPNQNYAMRQYVNGFNGQLSPNRESPREDLLTPSPQLDRSSKASDIFNRTSGYNFQFKPIPIHGTDHATAESVGPHGSQIAVEPMFGHVYGENARIGAQQQLMNPSSHHQYGLQKPSNNTFDHSSISGPPKDIFNPDGEYRGNTGTSSQRTLRYNDFELVQKQVKDDPAFRVHVDEVDDKESLQRASQDPDGQSVQYPDFKMQRLYESNQGSNALKDRVRNPPIGRNPNNLNTLQPAQGPPFQNQPLQHQHQSTSPNSYANSGKSLPKMALNQSINQQRKNSNERKHLNSNDTQLASHTINMKASQDSHLHSPIFNSQLGGFMPVHGRNMNRDLHRSHPPGVALSHPPQQTSKISVKHGVQMLQGPLEVIHQVGPAGSNSKRFQYPSPKPFGGQNNQVKLIGNRGKRSNGSDSNSRTRFNFVGPYAQNLKKPKVYEARGMQKIAQKNHLASLQQQAAVNVPRYGQNFNSEVFQNQKQSVGGGADSIMDPGDRHLERINSHNYGITGGNFVVQHQSLQPQSRVENMSQFGSLPQMKTHSLKPVNNDYQKSKRVWVPYNKKRQLKGMQQQLSNQSRLRLINGGQQVSQTDVNPLLNSQ